MQRIIVGNWKMNGSPAMARTLVPAVASCAAALGSKDIIVLCPPTLLLAEVVRLAQGSFLSVGAQDVSAQANGAYTGETSAAMLAEAGCRYVIVGHSERRSYHAEGNALVRAKADAALANGLTPIICVGETAAERVQGNEKTVVSRQLQESLPESRHFLLAYEPVWAIGSGRTPSVADISAMHTHIRESAGFDVGVLYGGSVNAANAAEIFAIAGVSGVLVGGASLKIDEFCGIIAAAGE
jgi:triosephosphate isomerase